MEVDVGGVFIKLAHVAKLSLYQLFPVCIPKSISSIHEVYLFTSASIAGQHFGTLIRLNVEPAKIS